MFYLACDCHPYGIVDKQCDTKTGMCQCKPNIVGQRCDRCQVFDSNRKEEEEEEEEEEVFLRIIKSLFNRKIILV